MKCPEDHRSWLERLEPALRIQREVRAIAELLRRHCEMGLSSGTDPDTILRHLARVRRAVLVVNRYQEGEDTDE